MVTDELGLFDERRTDRSRHQPTRRRRKPRRSAGRKVGIWLSVLVVLALIGGGVWYGLTQIIGIDFGGYDDYAGPGEQDVVVEIPDGASTGVIASQLHEGGVVASTKAFVKAAEGNQKVLGIQPGFYVMKTKVSGQDAIAQILNPESRKGQLEIRGGWQLENIIKQDQSVEPGIIQRLATASCAELNGKSTCVPVEELVEVARTGDLAALGVPEWAVPVASALEPQRRLEGLIMPGVYDVRPGSTAQELWQKVVTESATRLQAFGLPKIAEDTGFTPYQVLTMASLIEREAIEKDFTKVSRVTYNRLASDIQLQYDSTVNYVLDRPDIRTRAEDREQAGPYNTYSRKGLPPGPIAAPSQTAIEAAAKPAEGPWLYFVRCQKDGTSCFAENIQQHEQNVEQAQANGAY
ncbi:MAG TPA: endolytic transglycosylase MltG [Actinophytocola sp.]|uniref:endolytic transglycosylase MltG n=1 Tax=Actinophytocola sp. TaxID=1872138 RepID=UPI002DBF0C58|nr:endolytic transglycosylase MltG [Actinophytocola sp.]HEU5472833.1 endolytic transglycosylase MltG [Actinophytocola sp.]